MNVNKRAEQFARAVIATTLTLTGGAVAATVTLYEKIKRYGLSTKGESER